MQSVTDRRRDVQTRWSRIHQQIHRKQFVLRTRDVFSSILSLSHTCMNSNAPSNRMRHPAASAQDKLEMDPAPPLRLPVAHPPKSRDELCRGRKPNPGDDASRAVFPYVQARRNISRRNINLCIYQLYRRPPHHKGMMVGMGQKDSYVG